MTLTRFALSAAMVGAAAGAGLAQTASTQPEPKANQITITGCLERVPTASDALIGSNGVSPGPLFVLVKATEGVSGTAGATATSGTTRPQGPTRYRLQTPNVSDLVGHEGAEIQVTGTRQDPQDEAGGKNGGGAKAPTLKVASIKTVSSNCSR